MLVGRQAKLRLAVVPKVERFRWLVGILWTQEWCTGRTGHWLAECVEVDWP